MNTPKASDPRAGRDRYGWFVIFPADNMGFITRDEFRAAMPDGKAANHTAAAPEMEMVLKEALEQVKRDHEQIWADDPHPPRIAPLVEIANLRDGSKLKSRIPACALCCTIDRIKAVLYKIHPKVLHGECPVCGHAGEDCRGYEA